MPTLAVKLVDYLRFYVPLKNISLIWRRHHERWRAAKFRPIWSALKAFEQGGFFTMPHLLWHGTSVFSVSSDGPPLSVASYNTQGNVEDLFYPGSSRVPLSGSITSIGHWESSNTAINLILQRFGRWSKRILYVLRIANSCRIGFIFNAWFKAELSILVINAKLIKLTQSHWSPIWKQKIFLFHLRHWSYMYFFLKNSLNQNTKQKWVHSP
jgi:hypothetical protein